ncbi:hypothetical protein H0H81_009499 [Sphagnurus paluster]|uniref:Uncharacterized protein n=1 Tax=Sphagnurus paluster TaxID=117069 RepID=A0A9P7GW14_9AGAR|nr:hypothetical protein H0H81_009499 [Sphagnurus paluster]
MPRENSFTDSEGRSLTPDMDDDALGPNSPINSSNAPFTADTAGTWATPTIRESPVARPPSKCSIHSRIKSLTSHPSLKSPTSRVRADTWPASGLTPLQRFRAAVRKIIVMQRGTSHLAGINRVGAEPGVYPRRASANILYGHIHQECVIEVVDYSSVRSSVGRMTNAEFIDLMGNPEASAKEPWVKVRWINIGGVSWDVIKAVSIKYDLHPLSLESVFNERSQNRSKADYYSRHLFLRVLCHELNDDEDDSDTEHVARGSTLTGLPRSYSPASMLDTEHLPETMKGLQREDTMYDSRMVSASSTMKRRRFFPIPLLPSSNHDLDGMGVMGARAGSNSSLARLMSTVCLPHWKLILGKIIIIFRLLIHGKSAPNKK